MTGVVFDERYMARTDMPEKITKLDYACSKAMNFDRDHRTVLNGHEHDRTVQVLVKSETGQKLYENNIFQPVASTIQRLNGHPGMHQSES